MNEKRLTKKELSFCRWYSSLQNPREAAIKSGFTVLPEHKALSLLAKDSIIKKIKELEKTQCTDDTVISAGLSRLALGSIGDPVKLLLACSKGEELSVDDLDLFNVSEIKYTSGKGMEIKFFDRLKAFEALKELSTDSRELSSHNFYDAIERSVDEGENSNVTH